VTSWAISFGWNWLLIPVAVWFAFGLRRALKNPRIKYLDHVEVGSNHIISIRRQQWLPPWQQVDESWHVMQYEDHYHTVLTREGDGLIYSNESVSDFGLFHRIRGALRVGIARRKETEELVK
jgi:hypothetical protein